MIIKMDFVTNSSTVCFFAYGICFSKYDISESKEMMDYLYLTNLALNKGGMHIPKRKEFDVNEDDEYLYYAFESLAEFNDLDFRLDECSNYYIGRSPFNMKPDQTMSEFKKEVELTLAGMKLGDKKLSVIQEAWRDG